MNEIEVGLRIDSEKGMTFFGTDEINKLLSCGAKVIAIEPGGAITRQLKNDDGSRHIMLTGFSLIIKLESGTSESVQ
jgi:hypothetical protein